MNDVISRAGVVICFCLIIALAIISAEDIVELKNKEYNLTVNGEAPEGWVWDGYCYQIEKLPCSYEPNMSKCYNPVCVARIPILLREGCVISPTHNKIHCETEALKE